MKAVFTPHSLSRSVSLSGSTAKVVPEEITPLVPAVPGEKLADDQTCYILQTLLKFMVVQVRLLLQYCPS